MYSVATKTILWSMGSKAVLRSVNMTPFKRPLALLSDQLFVVSIKPIRCACYAAIENQTGSYSTACFHLSNRTVVGRLFFEHFRDNG